MVRISSFLFCLQSLNTPKVNIISQYTHSKLWKAGFSSSSCKFVSNHHSLRCLGNPRSYSQYSGMRGIMTFSREHNFTLDGYDCIGFDLDNTICQYKVTPMAIMEYNAMSRFMVTGKGYSSNLLFSPLTQDDIDFWQRGLILDFENGNVLKLGEDGTVIKASHGTKELSIQEIIETYGSSRKFKYSDNIRQNFTCAWEDDMRSKFRLISDYFDLPASLIYARAIDTVDSTKEKEYMTVGHDVHATLIYMYNRNSFRSGDSEYFNELKSAPHKYINKCSEEFKNWLKSVSKTKKLFLITGSNCDLANFVASFSLGENWQDFFDIIVCFARKPGFFNLSRPFFSVKNFQEDKELSNDAVKFGNLYNLGNWEGLQRCFVNHSSSLNPRFLYIGDNVVEDVYAPKKFAAWDTLAINEEMQAERIWKSSDDHPSSDSLASKRWGSYIFNEENKKSTLWGSVIEKHAEISIPSVNELIYIPFNK